MFLKGLFTALITPFRDGQLDLAGLELLISRQINAGVDGILVLGTTAETPCLSREEKDLIVKTAVKVGKGKLKILVGCGSNCSQASIEEGLKMKDLGADVLMFVCPYYNKPSQSGIYQHFKSIAQNVKWPICIYNIPSRTAVSIESKTILELAQIEEIIALKQATGDLNQAMELIHQRPPMSLLLGDDALGFPFLCLGGDGLISVTSNLMSKEMKDLVHFALKNDFVKSREIHKQLFDLFLALFLETNPVPLKAAMRACSLPAGKPRLPLSELSEKNERLLLETLKQHWIVQHKDVDFSKEGLKPRLCVKNFGKTLKF